MTIIIFILILAILVLVHEFGHFIAAKRAGVMVEEFGFGFPPRLFGIKKGETLYSVNLIPLGGFVKLYGEEYVEDKDSKADTALSKRAFVRKSPPVKAWIIAAGVLMNVLLASVIYYALLGTSGFKSDPIVLFNDYHFTFGSQHEEVVVAGVSERSPAAAAGVTPGDIVTGIRSDGGREFSPVASPSQLIAKMAQSQDKKVTIRFTNIQNGTQKEVGIVPRYDPKLKRAIIGIGLAQVATVYYAQPHEKLLSGFMHSYNMASYSLDVFGKLIGQSFKEKKLGIVGEAVSGPVGIFFAVSDTVKSSGERVLRNLAGITAILSISLAVVNTLPFPALDGGRFAFILYEWVSRRRINERVEHILNTAGIIMLLSLGVLVSVNDIFKLINLR